jgi:hypothetical protein
MAAVLDIAFVKRALVTLAAFFMLALAVPVPAYATVVWGEEDGQKTVYVVESEHGKVAGNGVVYKVMPDQAGPKK